MISQRVTVEIKATVLSSTYLWCCFCVVEGCSNFLSLSVAVYIMSFMSFCVTTHKDMILLNAISCGLKGFCFQYINSMVKV